jgi:DNA-directed RNA polymerase subunit RPC12/RpoP
MKICVKCGSEVLPEVSEELKKEYPYYCEECDENLYSFEVITT